ncbi:MAG: hypothetical protein IPO66_17825 [Rhodanobacteraceae bacterium]|nr:hypothetical protein [Rhodanobacteraceae bacterium]
MFQQLTARALLFGACALLAGLGHARGPDDDPEAGESWVTKLVRAEAREGYIAAGRRSRHRRLRRLPTIASACS